LLCLFGVLPWTSFIGLVVSGILFQMMIALVDTPFLYLLVYVMRKRFKLKEGEELSSPIL